MIEQRQTPEEKRLFIGYGNIGAFLRNHALKLVACVAVGAGVALASTWMISPLWQAKAIIQNGQLYWVTSAGPTVVTIEPPARTVDRIKVTLNLSPEGGRQEAGCHATSFSFLA
ncbi:hypothetical protein LMG18090_00792 [Ralstonia mannitolilytica]|uniref:hypothetical protein n=1 Tax=Ralstonia mannitolilytica TaxID=105219 RepID=UPI0028F4FFB4|nr:hypothetical protein [Ralstonia mannitolilytica]CAJ0777178.1 hypothetical protein LMG18090_00792 [Ralstonia mannitolilytica]